MSTVYHEADCPVAKTGYRDAFSLAEIMDHRTSCQSVFLNAFCLREGLGGYRVGAGTWDLLRNFQN